LDDSFASKEYLVDSPTNQYNPKLAETKSLDDRHLEE
jgi:hypothetical protein